MSGKGEEDPLKLGAIGVGGTVAVERALLEAGRDDLETGPVECRDAAASCVTTSALSRPSSIIFITPPMCALSSLQPPDHAGH